MMTHHALSKYCPYCQTVKLRSEFYYRHAAIDLCQARCQECSKQASKHWYQSQQRRRQRSLDMAWMIQAALDAAHQRDDLTHLIGYRP